MAFDWYTNIMKFKNCYTDEQIDTFVKTTPPKITQEQADEIKASKNNQGVV